MCVIKENVLDEESIGRNIKDKKILQGDGKSLDFSTDFATTMGELW